MATDYLSGFEGASGGGGQQGSFIGVPDDYSFFAPTGRRTPEQERNDIYSATFGGRGPISVDPKTGAYQDAGGMQRAPMYKSGAELSRLGALSTENLARLQGQMASVGLIGPETRFRVGRMDNATVTAYRNLLTVANRYAISDQDALAKLAESGSIMGGDVTLDANGQPIVSPAGPGKRTVTSKQITEPVYTDRATARAALRAVWQDNFGREPTDAEMRRYAKRLRAKEAGADVTTNRTTTRYDESGQETGSVTRSTHQDDDTDPSAEVVADQMARTGKLGRERNVRRAGVDYMGAILQLPGMNPGG